MTEPPPVRSVEPILPTTDISASVAWYTNVLGATNGWEWRDKDDPVPSHGGVRVGRAPLQFSLEPELKEHAGSVSFFFWTDVESSDALDAYAAIVKANGGEIDRPPRDYPWGLREFQMLDCHGYRIRFAGPKERPDLKREKAPAVYVEQRKPTVEEYATIIRGVGWENSMPLHRAADTLAGTRAGVVAKLQPDGPVVGCCLLTSDGVNNGYISDVAVLPDAQGRGVGLAMMRGLIDWCHDHLEATAFLTLFTGRDRAAFYNRLGFNGPAEGAFGMSRVLGPGPGDPPPPPAQGSSE